MNSQFAFLLIVAELAVAFRAPIFSGIQEARRLKSQPIAYGSELPSVNVEIGTPAQKFGLLLSLNFTDLWIVDKVCNSVNDCGAECQTSCYHSYDCMACCASADSACSNVKTRFDANSSTTHSTDQKEWKVADGLKGVLANDVVTLTSSGLTLQNATIVDVNMMGNAGNAVDLGFKLSGVFGLGLQDSSPSNTPSIFEQTIQLGLAKKPVIAIWMNKTRESKRSDAIGQIEFGGYDEKCSGNLTAIPIFNSNWAFAINRVIVGKYQWDDSWTGQITMDSDRIGIPIQFYNSIVKATDAVWNDDLRSYVVDCDKNVPIKFTTKTVDLIMETVDYTSRIGDQCVLELEQNVSPNEHLVSLGNKWLSRYCAILDVEKKQFAFTSISQST